MAKYRDKEKQTRRKSGCPVASIEKFTPPDEFTKHKREYERHAAAWLVARSRNDEKLLRKSAQQMLRHLREMYRLAIEPPKRSPSDQRLRYRNGG